MGKAPNQSRQRGFTLIEVLVAFAILALFLGAIMPSFSTSISATRTGSNTITAAAYAQSLIAGIGVDGKIKEGIFSNTLEEQGFESRIEIRPYRGLEAKDDGPRLYEVVALVSWQDGSRARSVSLSTYRLATGR